MFRIKNIIEYGLYLFVFFLPVQTRWIIKAGELGGGYSEYGTISLYGTDILLIVLIILFAVYKILNFKFLIFQVKILKLFSNFKFQISNFLIIGLAFFAFISIFSAPDKLLAVHRYGVFLLGVGLFWLVTSVNYNRVRLIYAFLGGVLLQASLGVWQFLSQATFANKWLGMAAHDPAVLGTSVVETLDGGRWLRAYGGLDHPNILGGFVTIGILLLMLSRGAKFSEAARQSRFKIFNFQFSIFNEFSFFQFSMAIIFAAVLFFTFSRGAWAGLIAGLLAMLAMAVFKKDYRAQKKMLQIILAGGALVFILSNVYGDLVLTRLSADTRLEAKSTTERLESYREAFGIIKDNWLFGAGMGNYVIYDLGFKIYDDGRSNNPGSRITDIKFIQPVHNTFLLVWAEIGIAGLMFFLSFILYALYFILCGWQNRKNRDIAGLGILTAIFVMMMVDHYWWSLHFGILLFWLAAGICAGTGKEAGPEDSP